MFTHNGAEMLGYTFSFFHKSEGLIITAENPI